MRRSPLHRAGTWEHPIFDTGMLSYFHKKDPLASKPSALFRHVQSSVEEAHPRTSEQLLFCPMRNELVYSRKPVPTFYDVLYSYYFPKLLNEDDRIKYVAVKSGRSEEDVAKEMLIMRRIKLLVADCLRNYFAGDNIPFPSGTFTPLEKQYLVAAVTMCQSLSFEWIGQRLRQPMLVYSPKLQFGDCVDFILTKPNGTTLRYFIADVVVHRSIPRCPLSHDSESPKFPLQQLEPTMMEAMKLRSAVLAHIVKEEQYVVDHFYDGSHSYSCAIFHFFPNPLSASEISTEVFHLQHDETLVQLWIDHYYSHHVAPRLPVI